jgi:epidermal growth factor receptor substrate 15
MLFRVASGSLNLNPDEKRLFGQLFQLADSKSVGVVTGEVAPKFFERSGLPPMTLGEVRYLMFTLSVTVLTRTFRFGISQIQRIEDS